MLGVALTYIYPPPPSSADDMIEEEEEEEEDSESEEEEEEEEDEKGFLNVLKRLQSQHEVDNKMGIADDVAKDNEEKTEEQVAAEKAEARRAKEQRLAAHLQHQNSITLKPVPSKRATEEDKAGDEASTTEDSKEEEHSNDVLAKANAMFGNVEEEDYSAKVKKMRVSINQRQSVMLRNLEGLRGLQVTTLVVTTLVISFFNLKF